MEKNISDGCLWRTAQRFVAIREVIGLDARVEVRDNHFKSQKTPQQATGDQHSAEAREFVFRDNQDAQSGNGKRYIFFARGGENTGDEKPYVVFVFKGEYGI